MSPKLYGNLSLLTGLHRCRATWLCHHSALRPNILGNMPQPDPVLRYTTFTSTLRPHTPMRVVTPRQRIQWRWQNLQCTALGCELFITLLHVVIFGLDPSQARLLEVHSDLSHIFDPLQPWPEERCAILSHLHRMARTAHEPILELSSDASRLEIWKALHQSVILKASPLTTLRVGTVKAVDKQNIPQPHGPSHGYQQSPLLESSVVAHSAFPSALAFPLLEGPDPGPGRTSHHRDGCFARYS